MRTKDFAPGQYLYGIEWGKDGFAFVVRKKIVHVGNKNIQVIDDNGEEEYTILPGSNVFTQKSKLSVTKVLYPNMKSVSEFVEINNISKEIERAVTTDEINELSLDKLRRIRDIIKE